MNLNEALIQALVEDQEAIEEPPLFEAGPVDAADDQGLADDREAFEELPLSLSKGAVPAQSSTSSILQLNPYPVTIDPAHYRNARSNVNPNGDLRSLFAFRDLVDPVPHLGGDYYSSGNSTETIYGQILAGANAVPGATFVAGIIASSEKAFHDHVFANLDGAVDNWRPVYASPEDWHDVSRSDRFRPLTIDLKARKKEQQTLRSLAGSDNLMLKVGTEGGAAPISGDTRLYSVEMNYLLVNLTRPWLNTTLFNSEGWSLGQQKVGFCSSGSLDENTGIFPLLPTSILLGMHARVSADWGKDETEVLRTARAKRQPVFVGPFQIDDTITTEPTLQVIGWVSSLIPLSPRQEMTRENGTSVTVD